MRLDWFDRKLVEFALAWAPYDGPTDDDTYPEFGMSAADLKARFAEIVAMQTLFRHTPDSDDWALLQRAQAHAYYLHITHQPPGVTLAEDPAPVSGNTGADVGTRPVRPNPVRYRGPSQAPQFSDAIASDGTLTAPQTAKALAAPPTGLPYDIADMVGPGASPATSIGLLRRRTTHPRGPHVNDAQLHTLLENTASHIGRRLDGLFDLLDLVSVRVDDLAGRASEHRKPVDRAALSTIRPLLQDILRRDEPLLEGIGVAVDQNTLSDAPRWLEWWRRDDGAEESHFMTHLLDPRAVGFYDYQSREWFVHPLADGRPRTIGPYVDAGGVDKYTVTLTIPVPLATGGRVVVGGDLSIAGLESYVLDQLGFRRPPVALVGNDRVIVSNSGRYVSGSRMRPQTTVVHTVPVPASRDERLAWRLVVLGPS